MMAMTDMEMNLSSAFQTDFKKGLESYLKMKDAFVASDAGQVSAFAKATLKELKSIDKGSSEQMVSQHLTKSMEMLEAISENDILENQRSHFVILNENMVAIAMNMDTIDSMLYVQKCPMANNNKGAVWLSAEKEVKNPYYGEAMLTCGSVVDEIK